MDEQEIRNKLKEGKFLCPKCKKPMEDFSSFKTISDIRCMNHKCWFYGIQRSFD